MKNLKYLLFLCLSAGLFFSCEYDTFEDEAAITGIDGTAQSPFVRVDNTLQGSLDATEEDGATSVTVENIFPLEEDVTVNYSLGGTATFGTDYTIDGATASGGSIVIPWEEAFGIALADIEITLTDDMDADNGETIVLTLTSASTASGRNVAVGQGTLHGDVTITIADAD